MSDDGRTPVPLRVSRLAKQYAGEETVDQVVASIPGLGQFI